jgi:hypothetical protein
MEAGRGVKTYFDVHEVVALTEFSKHMLDYLSREEIFIPTGQAGRVRGRKRRYTYEDVVMLRALRMICTRKGKVLHLRDSLRKFRTQFGPITPGQQLSRTLFLDGDKLAVYPPSEAARQLRSGQHIFSFVADLSVITQEVADSVVVDAAGRFRLTAPMARKAEEARQRTWQSIKARRVMGSKRRA